MLITEKESESICRKTLGWVHAEDAEVRVTSEAVSHLRFAANSFTTSGRRANASATITVWIDKKRGSATTNDLETGSLKKAVAEAEQLARISPVDREYLPTLGPQSYRPSHGFVEGTMNISLPARARAVDGIIRNCESKEVIGAGFHHAQGTATAYASHHGNFHYRRSSLASLSVTARTRDGGSSGYFLRNHFDAAKLDLEKIGQAAIRKALDSRSPRMLEPGDYPVILEAQAADDLIRFGFDARSADEGRSPYSASGGGTKVGQRIFDERLNVYSDPWHPELPAAPWAEDGIPAEKIYFVRGGTLQQLQYSRYWASQKGKAPTPGPVNTILEGTQPGVSVEEMIRAMERGLLVSRFWYIRQVDPRTALFTGLTRDGVWFIENGRIQYPVSNFRFNQSILELLAPGNVDLIGVPERVSSSESQGRSASITPALKVRKFHFTSHSEAV